MTTNSDPFGAADTIETAGGDDQNHRLADVLIALLVKRRSMRYAGIV